MVEKYYHRKLIRDKIPQIIKASGGDCEITVLGDQEFRQELFKKLIEEAGELVVADKEGVLNEMADVLQLLRSIADVYGVDFGQVEKEQVEKEKKRGGFKKKLFLVWSSNPAGK